MDEAKADETSRIVPAYHFSKEPTRVHGIPFNFVLLPVRVVSLALRRVVR